MTRIDEFRQRVADLIAEYPDTAGPRECPTHTELNECDSECHATVLDGWWVRDWVLVTGWQQIDPDGFESWLSACPSKSTPDWAISGLLHAAASSY